jgi:hypothetical protein
MKNRPTNPNSAHGTAKLPQLDKFRDLARELECDEDEAAFDERLKKMAKAEPSSQEPKR